MMDHQIKQNQLLINIKLKIKKIKYFYQNNKGFASARNFALKEAANEWVVILDHDDIALQNRLEIHANQITKHPNVKLFLGTLFTLKMMDQKLGNNFDIFNLKKIT